MWRHFTIVIMCIVSLWSGLVVLIAPAKAATSSDMPDTSRLDVYAAPPGFRVQVRDKILYAIPYDSLKTVAMQILQQRMRMNVVILYGVPIRHLTKNDLAVYQRMCAKLHASVRLLIGDQFSEKPNFDMAGVIIYHRKENLHFDGIGSVTASILPQNEQGLAHSFMMLHVEVPNMDVATVLQVPRQSSDPWPREQDVLLLQLSKLQCGPQPKVLTILDPKIAVVIDDTARNIANKKVELVENLYELWADVYRVEGAGTLTLVAGPHGLMLPLRGKHAHLYGIMVK